MTTDNGIQRVGQMGLAQFEPRDFTELEKLARMAASSRLFAVTSPESAIVIMLTGASLGVPPVVAMRSIHVVQGRAVLSSDLIHALVRRSGFCQSWHVSETTAERCTITTHRRGEPQPYTHTWTIAMARTADLAGKGTWRQYPAAMLRARCTAETARIVYPDVLMAGVYCEGEIDDDAGEAAAPKPVEVEQRRPAIDAAPQPLALPADNGPSPSQASAQRSAEAAAAPPPSDTLKAAVEQVLRASSVAGVAAACVAARDDLSEHEAAALWRASKERVVAVGGTSASLAAEVKRLREESAPKAAPPPDDEPPPDGPKGRRKAPAKAQPADATGDGADDRQTPVEGPAAWLASEDTTRAHVAAQRTEWEVQASARKHGRHLAAVAWGVRVYAERLQAMGVGTASQCERYVSAWAKAGPVVRAATAQRRAA